MTSEPKLWEGKLGMGGGGDWVGILKGACDFEPCLTNFAEPR